MYSWFEFNLAVFLCQETAFVNTNQKSNVKIDWCEWQIRFSECSHSHHITRMSEANECIITYQSNLVLCVYVNQIWFLFHSFLLRAHAHVGGRARVIISLINVLFANANKNKYSQQNHKWTCGCCLLILNYFLPLVSKYSRSLRTLILNWFILFRAGAREYHIKTKQKRLEIKMSKIICIFDSSNIKRTRFLFVTSGLYSRMPFLDTETRLYRV